MRFTFIESHREEFKICTMCKVLSVTTSGYYAWRIRPACRRFREDRQLEIKIRAAHQRSHRAYGSPRIHAALQTEGELVGRKRVERIMKSAGLRSQRRLRFQVTTKSNHSHPVAPNLLNRSFEAERQDQVWLGDITYIWTQEGWLYLAVLMDLFSRRIVGWATGIRLSQDLTLKALEMGLTHRGRAPEMHHTDRGSQYAAKDYQKVLTDAGVTISMSRKGNCWDNAPMESFFASFKTESLYHQLLWTREQAKRLVFEYVEVFYNRQRLHSTLGYLSPARFEESDHSGKSSDIIENDRPAENLLKSCGKSTPPQTPPLPRGTAAAGLT